MNDRRGMMDEFMTTPEMRLAQLACVQKIEDAIDDLEENGVEVPDALKAMAAEMRAMVEQALLDRDGEDRN
jgi:hypothetical protein